MAELTWKDGKTRCPWANPQNELYVRYHDEDWGVPVHDDHRLFEMLILESFQAGLSWECVLNKREAFRRAFDGFRLESVCAFDEAKLNALQQDASIIRNDVDKQVNIIVSDAEAAAAKLEAEGEQEYMRLLAEAYDTQDKKDFYEFSLALDALKASLNGDEKTVILDANSELAKILMGGK